MIELIDKLDSDRLGYELTVLVSLVSLAPLEAKVTGTDKRSGIPFCALALECSMPPTSNMASTTAVLASS